MPPRSVVSRTYPRVPCAAFGKNGESLDLGKVLDDVKKDAELVARYALKEMTGQNLTLVTSFDGYKPAEAGRRMGLFLPEEVKKPCISGDGMVNGKCSLGNRGNENGKGCEAVRSFTPLVHG